jgi:hypothetical protein
VRRSGDDTAVVLDVAGTAYGVRVRRSTGEEPHRLTCRAAAGEPPPAFEVLSVGPAPREDDGRPSGTPAAGEVDRP